MKLCGNEGCKCEHVQMCALCKHYNWNYEVLNNDLYADLMCNLKNDIVKGFDYCENFECFRSEDNNEERE